MQYADSRDISIEPVVTVESTEQRFGFVVDSSYVGASLPWLPAIAPADTATSFGRTKDLVVRVRKAVRTLLRWRT